MRSFISKIMDLIHIEFLTQIYPFDDSYKIQRKMSNNFVTNTLKILIACCN